MVQRVPCVTANAVNIPVTLWQLCCYNTLERIRWSSPFALEREKMFAHDRKDIGVGQTRSSTSARVVSEVKEVLKLRIMVMIRAYLFVSFFGRGSFVLAQIGFDMEGLWR